MNGEQKVTARHRNRTALVYIRQSTLVQVRDHVESTARQYDLAQRAVQLGWAASDVVVVDQDLGVSGTFGKNRSGFRELVSRVCLGGVGAVFGLEVSRLARSSAEFARLLELARLTDTLVIDADGVYDLSDVNDRLLLGLKGTLSEAELHLIASRLHGAKLAAAGRGELRLPLPIGYTRDEDGRCVKDPDEQVQAVVADLFTAFAATGSAYGVVGAFAGRGFPLRVYGGVWAGQLRFRPLNHARVVQILANPVYAGAYAYGRRRVVHRVEADGTVRVGSRKTARAEWLVLIQDHHEGYITWADYLANEAKLAANHTRAHGRPPREGEALCQGIIHCGVCGQPMGTQYRFDRYCFYDCLAARRDHIHQPGCHGISARTVDPVVEQAFLAAVAPEQVALALAAAEEVAARHTRTHRAAELAVQRARYEADRAERAFTQVEPENRLVARTLERRWETKLAALVEAELALQQARTAKPPMPEHDRLLAIARDLPRLWRAPATSPRDRKRLLRTLIADVMVLPGDDDDQAVIGIRWHTGATELIAVARYGPGRTPAEVLEFIRARSATTRDADLAVQLNAAGYRTGRGRRWDAAAVHRVRNLNGIRPPGAPTPATTANSPSSSWPTGSASPSRPSTTGSTPANSPHTAPTPAAGTSPSPTRSRHAAATWSPAPRTWAGPTATSTPQPSARSPSVTWPRNSASTPPPSSAGSTPASCPPTGPRSSATGASASTPPSRPTAANSSPRRSVSASATTVVWSPARAN